MDGGGKDGLKVSCSRIEGGRKEKGGREEVRGKQFKYRSMIPQLITHAAQLAALGINRFRLKALSNAYSVTPPAACSSRFYGDLSGSVTQAKLIQLFCGGRALLLSFFIAEGKALLRRHHHHQILHPSVAKFLQKKKK